MSLASASKPPYLKKTFIPIGETLKGRHGKKYRPVSNGENNAIPNPPSVKASSKPCEALTANKNTQISRHFFEKRPALRNAKSATTELNRNAKNIE
jgi:hypothetical protein